MKALILIPVFTSAKLVCSSFELFLFKSFNSKLICLESILEEAHDKLEFI